MSQTLDKVIMERGDIIICESRLEDVPHLAQNMRRADSREIWASNCLTPKNALMKGITESQICLTAKLRGVPVAMFGLVPNSRIQATIWLLGTNDLEKIPLAFGILSRRMLSFFHALYPTVCNYVDVRNETSIGWLRSLGAEFRERAPYGVMGMDFQFFYL